YFPVAARTLVDATHEHEVSATLVARVEALLSAVLLLDVSSEQEARKRTLVAVSELEKERDAAQRASLSESLEIALAHAQVISERKPIVDRLVRRILAVSMSKQASELEEAYSRYYREALDASELRQRLLFMLAILIVALGMTDVIVRVQRTASALEEATRELRSANEALAREREKERELGELKTRFVSMTSHEFRTPLSAILSSSEMLEAYGERWDKDRKDSHLERIRTAATGMTQMLDEILVIGRAEAGVLKPSPAPLDVDAFCRHLIETVEQVQDKPSRLRYQFTGDPRIVGDERLLTHVFTNLVGNALKYSPPDSEVLFKVNANGTACHFLVRDHGIGIPAEDLPKLFESFQRGSNVGQIKGSGLGLAVVKRALDVQKGSIEVKSEVGRGTEFAVMVPRDVGSAEQMAES
ncbi:MAG TPA: ATP-binding protein, partial [Polyangiaceae bacterium]|nr:ATP-binding protein [Polyangiaceae bacterium]